MVPDPAVFSPDPAVFHRIRQFFTGSGSFPPDPAVFHWTGGYVRRRIRCRIRQFYTGLAAKCGDGLGRVGMGVGRLGKAVAW